MSSLLNFYRGDARDLKGRSLEEILGWNDETLEEVHDFIQWLFPLPERSNYNHQALLLTQNDIEAFRSEPLLQDHLIKSFKRFLSFLGLTLKNDGTIGPGVNFSMRVTEIWSTPNHNWLRISRVLRSLRLLGLEQPARALYVWLHEQYQKQQFPLDETTHGFWTRAIGMP